jgi:1,4-dihydroxy-2-naphthoyl-CoA hydrolase
MVDLAALAAMMPLADHLGIRFVEASPDRVVAEVDHRPELCTAGGLLHGGVVMSLADTCGAACAFLNLPEGAGTSTIESKTNFLRGVRSGTLRAVSRPLHVGRTVIVVETELSEAAEGAGGRLAAKVIQTQAVLVP